MQASTKKYGEFYAELKHWDEQEFGLLTTREKADLTAIVHLARAPFPPRSQVLEIGFGNGGVLTYGRDRQWEMHGTEVNELLVQRARDHGFRAFDGEDLACMASESFDLVLAFDVLEHIPIDGIGELLCRVRRIAKERAVFIARFPNGDSPFSRAVQHGDPTHLTAIGSRMAAHLAKEAGMEVLYLGGEPQPLRAGLPHFCYRIITNPMRGLLNLCLNLLFYPGDPKPLCSRNLVMVLRVAKPAAS